MCPSCFRFAILLFVVSFGALGVACTDSDEPPLSEEMTITLLVEMHLLQGQRDAGVEEIPPRERIFQYYEVTEDQFDDAMLYYARYPDRYKELYSKVMDSLQVERDPEYFEQFQNS